MCWQWQLTGVGTRDASASKNSKEPMVAASEAGRAAAQPQTAKLGPRSSAEFTSQSFIITFGACRAEIREGWL